MSCEISAPIAGPDLVLYRGTRSSFRWRALQTTPYDLESNVDEVRLVVSTEIGAEAEIVAVLSSLIPAEITIEGADPSYFLTVFDPAFFDDLPESEYVYAIYAYVGAVPFILTLPAKLTVTDVIGPPEA